jgi:elongation factor 1-alpha
MDPCFVSPPPSHSSLSSTPPLPPPLVTVVLLGDEDSGKSTLIGVLSTGSLDNGCGMKRLEVFRHAHEITHGRTSSISHQVLGAYAATVLIDRLQPQDR